MTAHTSWQQAFGHASRIFGLAFHPSSAAVVASASEDETVRIWGRDSSSGAWQQTSCCRGHTSEVLRVAWSPDGRLLASGSADHTVRFWAVSTSPTQQHSYTGSELAVLTGHPEEVYAVHFLQDTPAAAPAAGSNGSHAQQQQQRAVVQHTAEQLASSTLDSSPAKPHATSSSSGSASSNDPGAATRSSLLLTASGEALYLWDIARGQLLQQSAPLPVLKASAAFAGALSGAAAGSSLGAQQVLQQQQQQQQPLQQQPLQQQLQARSQAQNNPAAAVGPSSGQQQGSGASSTNDDEGSGEGSIITESEEDESEGLDEPPPSYVFSVGVCPETNWVAANCSDGMLRLWDASRRSLAEIAAVLVHPGQMGSVAAWLPQQPLWVSSISKGGQLVLQDVRLLGRPLIMQQLQGPVLDAVWTRDTGGAAAGGSSGSSSSSGSLRLVVAGRDSCLRSYALTEAALQQGQLPAPQLLHTPGTYSGSLLALAASADGRLLAAAGETVLAEELSRGPRQPPPQQQQPGSSVVANSRGGEEGGGQPAVAAAPVAARRGRGRQRRQAGGAGAVDLLSMLADDEPDGSSAGVNAAAAAAQPSAAGHGSAANCAAAGQGVLMRAPIFVLGA